MKYKNLAYKILRILKDNSRLLMQCFSVKCRRKSFYPQKCHFLVVNNPVYAHLAMYGIASLLYFNREVQVTIHCDSKCYKTLKWKTGLLFGHRTTINIIESKNSDPMYEKAKLLISLQGTYDYFIDADTRINGLIPDFSKPAVLVREFSLDNHIIWRRISEQLGIDLQKAEMLNTTFFTWSGKKLALDIQDFEIFYHNYLNIDWNLISRKSSEWNDYKRLVEQFFFSIVLSNSNYSTLKDQDSVADKGVIESSYFGASGYRFGR